ncbi:extracellular solute-binding protein [Paenibacillus sp. S-38]|uniref:extracellular solute-binding protein n=1 Tax=Paenibacillus sp. S-38 TaxID=3416710 RepID=UPI003CF1CDB5
MKKKINVLIGVTLFSVSVLSGCSGGGSSEETDGQALSEDKPYPLTLVVNQVGEIPAKGNEIEQAIMKYTNTQLEIQWIPTSAYDEKINVMIASGELPKLMKLGYNPTTIASLKSDLFWEIGPYLKDYKNLSAQNPQFYNNINVQGKIYGIPLFRELGRSTLHYRKDWFDSLGLKPMKTLDDWYNNIKALVKNDPDKNGKDDTYGILLDKKYNQEAFSTFTRISVSQGGPNKWQVDAEGNFTPDFMTEPYYNVMKLFKRLYEEKLINQDFPVVDSTEMDKLYDSGRAGFRYSGGSAQSWHDKIIKVIPGAVIDVAPVEGPDGRRLPGENGNAGFLAIPKATVKTEAEMKRVLKFIDQLMDPEMATLLVKGVEGKHWKDAGDFTEVIDRDAEAKEVKPYRDTLPQRGEQYNIAKPSKQPELFRKGSQIGKENEQYIVTNPALNLDSTMYYERGKELEVQITDAQTKFIMGQIDEEGWKKAVDQWKKAGGEQIMKEYKEAYLNGKK